eukprot:1426638-Prymnesium_polylepis.1
MKGAAIRGLTQLLVPVFAGGGAADDAQDDNEGSTLIAVIKVYNKVNISGTASGVPFERRDEIMAGVYATLIVEALTSDHGVKSQAHKSSLADLVGSMKEQKKTDVAVGKLDLQQAITAESSLHT